MIIQDMPSMVADDNRLPDADQQAEFERQLGVLVNEHKSYTCIITWIIYNEGWAQLRVPPYPEEHLTDVVRSLDPTRLIDAVTGWYDHGFGDFSVGDRARRRLRFQTLIFSSGQSSLR